MYNNELHTNEILWGTNPFTKTDFLRQFGQPVIAIDLQGEITFWNDAATQTFGWTSEEALGKPALAMIPAPETQAEAAAKMKDLCLGQAWSGECVMQRKNRTTFSAFVINLPYYDHDQKLSGIISLSFEITEQKISGRQLSLLLNNTEEAFILLDAHFHIVAFNRKATDVYNKHMGSHLQTGVSMLSLASPERAEVLKKDYQKALEGEEQVSDISLKDKEGNESVYTLKYKPGQDEAGNTVGIFIAVRDVTAQKKSEAALHANEARWQAMVENIHDIFLLIDNEGYVQYSSPSIKKILGYDNFDLLQEKLVDYIHSDDQHEIKSIFNRCLTQTEVVHTEGRVRIKSKNGNWVWIESSMTNLLHNNSIDGIIFTARDVSELVKNAARLKEEQDSKEALINNTDDLIWSLNENFELIAANKAFLAALQNNSGLLVQPGDNLMRQDKFSTEWLYRWQNLYSKAFTGESFLEEMYSPVTDTRHTESWAEINFKPIWHNDRVSGIACYSRNITERKKKEESDKQSAILHSLHSVIVNNSEDAILSKDLDGIITSWNMGAEKIFGYSAAEIIGKSISVIIPPDLVAEEDYIISEVKAERPVKHYETQRLHKQGNRISVSFSVSPILDINGKVVGASKIARDITQQKKDAAALMQNEARLQGIINSQNSYVIRTDMHNNYSYYNNKFFEDYGWIYQHGNLLGRSAMDAVIPSHQQLVTDTMHACIAEPHKVFQVEMGKPFWDGSIKTTIWDFICLTDIMGNPVEIQCVGIDITQRVHAEKQLLQSLEERNIILESIQEGFFAVDKNWIVTYWNSNAEKKLGISRAEVLGKDIWMLFPQPGGTTSMSYTNFKNAIENNEIKHYEYFHPPTNEWFETSLYPSITGLSVYFRDVTERKKADDFLKETIERFNLVSLATNDVIWDWNVVTGTVERSADNMEKLFGYEDMAEINNIDFWMLNVHPDDKERISEQFRQTFHSPEANFMDSEYRFKKADNTYAQVYDKGYILRDAAGTPVRMIGAVQDVTMLKQNELLLQKRAEELAFSNQELEQFAFIASHDLQEPLRMVTSFLTKLNSNYGNVLDDRAKTYVNFAVDGAKRMRQIILDLLDYSRVGKAKEKLEIVNLNTTMEEILLLYHRKIIASEATITFDQLPEITTHRGPLSQLLQNLVSNALNFAKPGIAPRIVVSATKNEYDWTIAVQDNGIGIDPAYFEKIFVIFQRLHNKEEYEGTGIGLSVAKKIAETLGGKIWVESIAGQGSTFFFTVKNKTRHEIAES